jgi:hypothetical protein
VLVMENRLGMGRTADARGIASRRRGVFDFMLAEQLVELDGSESYRNAVIAY